MYQVAVEHADNYRLEVVKDALRRCFQDLGFPAERPLSAVIKPGDRVFIKPNWVASRWRESCPHKDTLYCVITHPNVIEAVADFAAEALQGEGELVVGDNPSIDADFSELMAYTGIERLKTKYDIPVSILDLRPLVCKDLAFYGKKDLMSAQEGDPSGQIQINLGKDSLLYGLDPTRFRGVFDEREDTVAAHTGERQLYTFARSIYDADVYISIPKLKTHQKVGATLNLKGLVGTVSDKNQLVHWQVGYPAIGGDEYPDRQTYEKGLAAKVKHRGAWPGNDTIWRMVCDLYQGFQTRERRYFSVVDGIVAGEGQGPFCPTSKNANTLIAGDNLLAVDCAAVRYMGFDPARIRYLSHFLNIHYEDVTLDGISVIENGQKVEDFFRSDSRYADFFVPIQWRSIQVS